MKLCTACRRHVRPRESNCPFCGEALRTIGFGNVGAIALFGALGAACADRPSDSGTEGSSTGVSTGTTGTTSTIGSTDPTTGTSGTTTTSAGELSSSSDPSDGDTGCSFYGGCPTDVAAPEQCDPFLQDCPEGQKCVPASLDGDSQWESLICVPIDADPVEVGETCQAEGVSGIDDCVEGAICWPVDLVMEISACAAQCTGSLEEPACEDPNETCVVANAEVISLCLPKCNPLLQDCLDGQVCVTVQGGDDFVCVFDASGDAGEVFDPCGPANVCDPGLACKDPVFATDCDPFELGCCLPYCDTTMMNDCPGAMQECIPWYEGGMAPAGLESVGFCGIPQ